MMNWKTILLSLPVLALSLAPQLDARDYDRDDWNRRNENQRYDSRNRSGYTRLDRNRDGAIERYEWRGSNRTFNRLDRNNDGRITPRDRYDRDYNRDNRYWYRAR